MISIIRNIINKQVDERINEILKCGEDFEFKHISDEQAKKEVSSFIIESKSKGIEKLSTLDFVLNLKLPADQVEGILEKFEEEEKIKEING